MLWFRAPEKVYFKKGCLPVALEELRTLWVRKRRLLLLTRFLYSNGYTEPGYRTSLDEMGIKYSVFSEVAPDPTLPVRYRRRRSYDGALSLICIIAIGGGCAMDAA